MTYRDVLPQFVLSDRAHWNDVVQRIGRGVDWAMSHDDGMDAAYAQITRGARDTNERIDQIHDFVSRKIRYVSMSEGKHDVVPHPVADTLANRYGDCKDKSALLLALLKRADVDAYPVLVATSREDPSRLTLPGTTYFDHMVVCFNHHGERCLDPTSRHSGPGYTPSFIQGNVRLDLLPDAQPKRIPAARNRWTLEVDAELAFNDAGNQVETLTRRYSGPYAAWVRGRLAGRNHANQQEWALDHYQSHVSDKVSPVFEFGGLDTPREDMVIRSKVTWNDLATPGETLKYTEDAHWIAAELRELEFENKHFDYPFSGLKVRSRYRFDFDGMWKLQRPVAELDLKSEFGRLTRNTTVDGFGKVTVEIDIDLPARKYALEQRERFNRFLEIVQREAAIGVRGEVIASSEQRATGSKQ